MSYIKILGFSILIIFSNIAYGSNDEHVGKVELLVENEKYLEAERYINKNVKKDISLYGKLLGYVYINSGSYEKQTKGVEILKEESSKGDLDSKHVLAYAYRNGIGVKKDIDSSISLYKEIVENGDDGYKVNAFINIHDIYKLNDDKKDLKRAFIYLKKAALLKYNPAIKEVVKVCLNGGYGRNPNIECAVDMANISSKAKYSYPYMMIGEYFKDNKDFSKRDYKEAIKWFFKARPFDREAADSKIIEIFVQGGYGVDQDFNKARELEKECTQYVLGVAVKQKLAKGPDDKEGLEKFRKYNRCATALIYFWSNKDYVVSSGMTLKYLSERLNLINFNYNINANNAITRKMIGHNIVVEITNKRVSNIIMPSNIEQYLQRYLTSKSPRTLYSNVSFIKYLAKSYCRVSGYSCDKDRIGESELHMLHIINNAINMEYDHEIGLLLDSYSRFKREKT